MKTAIILAITLMSAASQAQATDFAHWRNCSSETVLDFGIGISGQGLVCSTRRGLSARLGLEGLTAGDAYTVWWGYIDDPQTCENPGMCADVDFGGDNPPAVVGRFDSAVAGARGQLRFSDRLRNFVPSAGSQVWLIVFGHGPADDLDNRQRARQLLTPEDPAFGAPQLGNIVDGQLGFPVTLAVFAL